uniref:Uncharacterized protein n=1 Tax=Schlesneria paludicola TaxID=360056 RepID=A0A7C2K1G8_9PLAN
MNSTSDDSDEAPLSHGEALANAWADGAAEDAAPPLDAADARRAADVAFLHGLLEQALRPDPAARERRIQRATAAIRSEVQPASSLTAPRRRRWLATLATVAAVVVVGFVLRNNLNPKATATAAVSTALEQASSSADRAYQLTTSLRLLDGETRDLTADLWVRGGGNYVLRQDAPLGDAFLGSNGVEHWVVPAVGPVLVGTEPGLAEQWLLREKLASPFLQLTSILERMQHRYTLRLGEAGELTTSADGQPVWCTLVIGEKQDLADVLAPDVIRLWTARQSGIAQQVEMTWNRPDDQPGVVRVVFRLQPTPADLPENWYDHAAHHAPDRRVIQRGESAESDL